MCPEFDRTDFLTRRIHDADSTGSVAHPNISGLSVIPDVVGVSTQLEGVLAGQCFSIVDAKLAISSRGNKEPSSFSIVVDALWFFETFDLSGAFSSSYIDDFDGAILESSNE